MAHIFISYAKKDTRPLAEALYRALNSVPELTAWMDMSLEADASWAYQIQQEIDRCDYFVVLLSPDVNRPTTKTQRRSFVLNEIDYAQQDNNKPILPVMAQQTKMPVQIAGIQYIDLTRRQDDPTPVVERICRRFGIVTPTERMQREAQQQREREQAAKVKQEQEQQRQREAQQQREREHAAKVKQEQERREPAPVVSPSPAYAPYAVPEYDETPQRRRIWMTAGGTLVMVIAFALGVGVLSQSGGQSTLSVEDRATLEVAQTPVTRNADWTPVEQEFDGVMMVQVPAGCFMMGSNDGYDDEQPVHEICFDEPFWIDKYEVTNADYGSVGCEQYSSDPDQPRNCVDWFDASDFCEAREARLPTEAEWEYAARGPDALAYPWGNDYDAGLVIGEDDPTYGDTRTAPVGSRPGGASWVGALDMSGNLWEWTSSLYEDYPYSDDHESNSDTSSARVLRGGSFLNSSIFLRAANRSRSNPFNDGSFNGFRCARSY